jgi:homopolymeric O-antigen transport system permease protein
MSESASVEVSEAMPVQAIAGATPVVVIESGRSLLRGELPALWEFRELLYFMVWREVKTRYKQTALGVGWAVLQPLLTTAIFTIVFAYFARMPSEGIAYPLFALSGLLPWSYFSQALARSSVGLVTNANLISKVYFPRLILPISSAATPLVDFALTLVLVLGLMGWYHITPSINILLLPFFVILAFGAALSVSLWLSALNVKYRDVGHLIPFLIQIWMYASPVVYPTTMVPDRWRLLYGINPMVTVIDGFRWCLLGTSAPDATLALVSSAATLTTLASGFVYFKATERTFADVI